MHYRDDALQGGAGHHCPPHWTMGVTIPNPLPGEPPIPEPLPGRPTIPGPGPDEPTVPNPLPGEPPIPEPLPDRPQIPGGPWPEEPDSTDQPPVDTE
jgi:hypothetical protein